MQSFNILAENFQFLVLEITGQVDNLQLFLANQNSEILEKIESRDDYIDNLKSIIENESFAQIHRQQGQQGKTEAHVVRAKHTICVNLERIGDYCVNIARQVGHIKDVATLQQFNFKEYFAEIRKCFPLVLPVLESHDLTDALTICHAELNLDRKYKSDFDLIRNRLRAGEGVDDQITILFIIRYLERIGDALLNIGEALLFVIIGEKVKISQYHTLQKTLNKSGLSGPVSRIYYDAFWGTRSGCQISKVGVPDPECTEKVKNSIYKGGDPDKINAEKSSLEHWDRFFPGLTPKIISYHQEGDKAALLVEYLSGFTLEEALLNCDDDLLGGILTGVDCLLIDIWSKTKIDQPIQTNYIDQLVSRLEDIREVHPNLFQAEQKIGGKDIISTMEMISRAGRIEKQIVAPFSVYLHGDCNANNLLYSLQTNKLHFIDVHRSRQGDYLQDLSVLMVSFFRLPIFEEALRLKNNWVISLIYQLGQFMANQYDDRLFDVRLSLALSRSFFTSTRFELRDEFAKVMFCRGRYLLEKLIAHEGRPWDEYHFNEDVLYYS